MPDFHLGVSEEKITSKLKQSCDNLAHTTVPGKDNHTVKELLAHISNGFPLIYISYSDP